MTTSKISWRWPFILCSTFTIVVLSTASSLAQELRIGRPDGEEELRHARSDHSAVLRYHERGLHYIAPVQNSLFSLSLPAPKMIDISFAGFKVNSVNTLVVAESDGSTYEVTPGPTGISVSLRSQGGPLFTKLAGDALYGMTASSVYVSRDTARTWQLDTASLGVGGFPYDIAVDTLQYPYLAYSSGLYKQHPDSSVWHKVNAFPGTSATSVFVDRINRVFAAAFSRLYLSTDNGLSWAIDTSGLNGKSVTGLCDDVFGNVYARSATGLWRSSGGTQPWVAIDQPLTSLAYDPTNARIINDISGDTLLSAATVYGGYVSSDQGTTWTRDTVQFSASFTYGFAKTPAGRLLTSTNLGVFLKNPADVQWTKTFPPTGYLAASPVFLDGSGNAYALGKRVSSAPLANVRANWKSTDGGATWAADTAGLGGGGTGQLPLYAVDEFGAQHYGAYGSPANLYSKVAGLGWTPDTAGYGSRPSEYPTAFGSDHHGFLYVATLSLSTYTGMVWKRPIGGGAWTPDTSGLGGTQIYCITADKNGNPIAGATDGVYRKSGGVWTKIPSPPGLSGYSAFVVSGDSSGNTIAGFSTYGFPNYLWRGVYATSNGGSTWTFLGLDSVSVRGLISYGDSTFAYSYADGLYLVRSTVGVTSVDHTAQPSTFALLQNYPNPFNPTTEIRYQLSAISKVSLKVYDLLGREVETLVEGEMTAGAHRVTFDASRFASGIYFYRLKAGDFIATKKLVLIK